MGKDYFFNYAVEDDIQILINLAKDTIIENYSIFLEKDKIKYFLESGECDREIIENKNNCIIMKSGNEYIGFSITLGNILHLMMISPKYQNQGYGAELLKHTEKKLFNEFETIELQSFSKNIIANMFYEKNGWKNIEKMNNNDLEFKKYIKNKI